MRLTLALTASLHVGFVHMCTCSSSSSSSSSSSASNVFTAGPGEQFRSLREAACSADTAGSASQSAVIELRGGVWPPQTLQDTACLGSTRSVVVRPRAGEEVVISAGRQVPTTALRKQDAGIYSTLLPAAIGLHPGEYGGLTSDGCGSLAQVSYNGEPMTLARFPNVNTVTDTWNFAAVDKVVDPAGAFTMAATNVSYPVNATRLAAWAKEKHLWIHGYFGYDWADTYKRVESINVSTGVIVTTDARHGLPQQWSTVATKHGARDGAGADSSTTYPVSTHNRVLAVNARTELDHPNEFYIDYETGMLSLIPPHGGSVAASDKIVVSVNSTALEFNGSGTMKPVRFEHLQFSDAQSNAARVVSSVAGVSFFNCTFRNSGSDSAVLDGSGIRLDNCTVKTAGCAGVVLSGGDRNTLRRSENVISNSSIFHFSLRKRTYTPGLSWNGVGHTLRTSTIRDAPHSGVLGEEGNDCLFERNIFERLVLETSDAGAFYSGRRWDVLGNIIRFNTFRNIRSVIGGINALYFDDQMSGWEVYNNSFSDCEGGIVLGGGRRTHIKFNSFENCDWAIHTDDRGMNGLGDGNLQTMLTSFARFNVTEPPWATRYPYLANELEDHPGWPEYNQIAYNRYRFVRSDFMVGLSPAAFENYHSSAFENSQVNGVVLRPCSGLVDRDTVTLSANGTLQIMTDPTIHVELTGENSSALTLSTSVTTTRTWRATAAGSLETIFSAKETYCITPLDPVAPEADMVAVAQPCASSTRSCSWTIRWTRSDMPGQVSVLSGIRGPANDSFAFEGCSTTWGGAASCIKEGVAAGARTLRNRAGEIVALGVCCNGVTDSVLSANRTCEDGVGLWQRTASGGFAYKDAPSLCLSAQSL